MSEMFSGKHDESEPCDGCGKVPSVHMGHGSYSCKACFEDAFCEKCRYMKNADGSHECPSPEEHARRKAEFEFFARDASGEEPLLKACMRLRGENTTLTADRDRLREECAKLEEFRVKASKYDDATSRTRPSSPDLTKRSKADLIKMIDGGRRRAHMLLSDRESFASDFDDEVAAHSKTRQQLASLATAARDLFDEEDNFLQCEHGGCTSPAMYATIDRVLCGVHAEETGATELLEPHAAARRALLSQLSALGDAAGEKAGRYEAMVAAVEADGPLEATVLAQAKATSRDGSGR